MCGRRAFVPEICLCTLLAKFSPTYEYWSSANEEKADSRDKLSCMGRSALSWHSALGAYPTCAQQEAKEEFTPQIHKRTHTSTHSLVQTSKSCNTNIIQAVTVQCLLNTTLAITYSHTFSLTIANRWIAVPSYLSVNCNSTKPDSWQQVTQLKINVAHEKGNSIVTAGHHMSVIWSDLPNGWLPT